MQIPEDNLFFGLKEKMTWEQEYLRDSIINHAITFCDAPAGSGKTTIAYATLKYLYECKLIDKIYYIFSPVEEDKMGYRPGSQKDKEEEYTHPLRSAMIKCGDQPEKATNPKTGWVEMKSDTFLRGTDIERCGVILDEAQNYTFDKMKKTITRLHDCCYSVIIGHHEQCDLPNPNDSGFVPYLNHFLSFDSFEKRVRVCTLTKNFRGWVSNHADKLKRDKMDQSLPNIEVMMKNNLKGGSNVKEIKASS